MALERMQHHVYALGIAGRLVELSRGREDQEKKKTCKNEVAKKTGEAEKMIRIAMFNECSSNCESLTFCCSEHDDRNH